MRDDNLKHKKDLTELFSIKDDIETKLGLTVGAVYLLKSIADRLQITKAFGEMREGRLPKAIPQRNVVVATRKKLVTRRKC